MFPRRRWKDGAQKNRNGLGTDILDCMLLQEVGSCSLVPAVLHQAV